MGRKISASRMSKRAISHRRAQALRKKDAETELDLAEWESVLDGNLGPRNYWPIAAIAWKGGRKKFLADELFQEKRRAE